MGRVVAIPEDARRTYIGFLEDTEILECSECAKAYRLRYEKEEYERLPAHRRVAHLLIEIEHPNHTADLELSI
jgi:hypothetical protein